METQKITKIIEAINEIKTLVEKDLKPLIEDFLVIAAQPCSLNRVLENLIEDIHYFASTPAS
jgi:hypothetical protein